MACSAARNSQQQLCHGLAGHGSENLLRLFGCRLGVLPKQARRMLKGYIQRSDGVWCRAHSFGGQ